VEYTGRGYEVPGIILVLNLKGAMRPVRSQAMSLPVSACTDYDFNTLTPVV